MLAGGRWLDDGRTPASRPTTECWQASGMRPMNGSDVENALTEMVQVLAPQTDRDWQIHAGYLE